MDTSHPNYKRVIAYINREHLAVVSTAGSDYTPHGASMWLIVVKDTPYFITGTNTHTNKNLSQRNAVYVTVSNAVEASSLQLLGETHVVTDTLIRDEFLQKLRDLLNTDEDLTPLAGPDYAIIGITAKSCRFTEYPGQHIFERTVTEM